MSPRGAARLFAAGFFVLASAACGYEGLSFVKDDRVEIVSPPDRTQVGLPVTIRWRAEERDTPGSFGVFLDRAPQPPGERFEWFAEDDHQCKVVPGCPDRAYFAARGIYVTDQTSFTIAKLPDLRPERERRFRDFHEVIVVLLDADGRRIGETAFSVEFELKRGAA